MVIRHEPPSHHSRAPPVIMSNSNGGAMHPSYHYLPSHHGHHPNHMMHQQQFHQHHAQYYAPPPQHNPSPRTHHQYSPNNAQSPSHHAAVALQSMHQQHYYHNMGHPTHAHFASQHGPPMPHPPSKPTTSTEITKEHNQAEGFNMLIAAATSESMNSIDEEESKVTTATKGILKKHPRGKQLVSPLETEDKPEQEDASERRDDKEQVEDAKEEAPSAGPLKKRRKLDQDKIDGEVTAFLMELHDLLSGDSCSEAMEWLPHGKAFRVLRWDILAEKVLPDAIVTLKQTDDIDVLILTFRGLLRECGFVEVKRGKEYGSYCHRFFIKDEPELINNITPNSDRNDISPTYELAQSGSSLDGGMEWRSTRRGAQSIFNLPRTDDGHQNRTEQPHPSYLHMPVLTTTATASFAENWGSNENRNNCESRPGRPTSDASFPRPYPPQNSLHRTDSKEGASGRSPKIIRFREDEEAARSHSRMQRHGPAPAIEFSPNDGSNESRDALQHNIHYDMVQITPNPDYEQPRSTYKPHFPVSRRGGRGGGMMRPVPSSRHVKDDAN